jgi:hypothetical protein
MRARLACRALVVSWTSLLLPIRGALSFHASPSSNVYALPRRMTCPILLDRDFCAREHCLRHFVPVSLLKFLMSP